MSNLALMEDIGGKQSSANGVSNRADPSPTDDSSRLDSFHEQGVLHFQAGKYVEAAESLQKSLLRTGENAIALHHLGAALSKLGKHGEAAKCFQRSLKLNPHSAEVHFNFGVAAIAAWNTDQAIASFRQALRITPSYAEAAFNLGNALKSEKRFEEAIKAYQQALHHRLDYAKATLNLCTALQELKREPEAEQYLGQLLQRQPTHATAWKRLGLLFVRRNALEEALRCFREAVRLDPAETSARVALGAALFDLGSIREGLVETEETLRMAPGLAESHLNRALSWLKLGDYRQGWLEYEWRWHTSKAQRPTISRPLWDGRPLNGKSIVLHAEQGLGDTLQFVRYARLIRDQGGKVSLCCQKPLVPLFSRCEYLDQVVAFGEPIASPDFYAPLMSLPAILETSLEDIPAETPYLQADPALVEHWRARLAGVHGLKIGIAWQGNPDYVGDRTRSIPLAAFAPLSKIPGVQLISLQCKFGLDQLDRTAPKFSVVDFRGELDVAAPFLDTAAVMKNLDLVISCDSATAHLAGALDVPVWLALARNADWRWLEDRLDSPWYPSMRLFRQRHYGDWGNVIRRMSIELGQKKPNSETKIG